MTPKEERFVNAMEPSANIIANLANIVSAPVFMAVKILRTLLVKWKLSLPIMILSFAGVMAAPTFALKLCIGAPLVLLCAMIAIIAVFGALGFLLTLIGMLLIYPALTD